MQTGEAPTEGAAAGSAASAPAGPTLTEEERFIKAQEKFAGKVPYARLLSLCL
jgi:hypothetical protein